MLGRDVAEARPARNTVTPSILAASSSMCTTE
jgi:hypothetical protein